MAQYGSGPLMVIRFRPGLRRMGNINQSATPPERQFNRRAYRTSILAGLLLQIGHGGGLPHTIGKNRSVGSL